MVSTKILDEIIEIAKRRNVAYLASGEFDFPKADKSPEETLKLIFENKLDTELENFLMNLTEDEIHSVQAIMYIGQEYDSESFYSSANENHQSMLDQLAGSGWNTKEIEVHVISEKMPLDEYLINGKRRLNL